MFRFCLKMLNCIYDFQNSFFFLKISKPVLTNFIKSEFSTVSKDHEFHDFAIECFILFPRSSHLPKNVTYWLLQLIKVSKVEVSNTPPNFAHLRCNSKVILPAQCRNFIIFLPLRFYKKAILGILCISAKSAILTHLEALNFDFYKFYQSNKIQCT